MEEERRTHITEDLWLNNEKIQNPEVSQAENNISVGRLFLDFLLSFFFLNVKIHFDICCVHYSRLLIYSSVFPKTSTHCEFRGPQASQEGAYTLLCFIHGESHKGCRNTQQLSARQTPSQQQRHHHL